MKLTNPQKAMAAVLALGLGALVVDRGFMAESVTEPASAAAALSVPDADRARRPAKPNAVVTAALPDQLDESGLLPVRLAQVSRDQEIVAGAAVDAFAPTAAAAPEEAAQVKARTPQVDAGEKALAEFAAKHRLTGVMVSAHGGIAMVDGKAVRVGETFEEFVLAGVGSRSAKFKGEAGLVELKLPEPGAVDKARQGKPAR